MPDVSTYLSVFLGVNLLLKQHIGNKNGGSAPLVDDLGGRAFAAKTRFFRNIHPKNIGLGESINFQKALKSSRNFRGPSPEFPELK